MQPEHFIAAGYALAAFLAFRRSASFGVFALVILAFPTFGGWALQDHLGPLGTALPLFQLLAITHVAVLVLRPRLRSKGFRHLVSIPALWFTASTFLALPWLILSPFVENLGGAYLPFALGLVGVGQSLYTREETVDLALRPQELVPKLQRWSQGKLRRAPASDASALSFVQITDPHLGPFMSVDRLRRICQRAVDRQPNLILLTGDLMTMESQRVEVVLEALAPLAAYEGRVFACHGNHDHEARAIVEQVYQKLGIRLLVDQAQVVETPSGPVQIVGADFVWKDRAAHLKALCEANPRVPGAFRLWLQHDPGAFRHIPEGEADLVLSGHTHGGQIGLVSLGLPYTFVGLVTSIPDHGLWARGHDRLYVHRAQGLYGFPIRLGVPAEQSLVRVWR